MFESIIPLEPPIYSVSQLNKEARYLLESALPTVWIEGEISNLYAPGSGHLYFSLKDALAQVRCALFRGRYQIKQIQPKNGMQVLVRASVSLYEERGDFQLIVEYLEEVGDGALQRAFEKLKQHLAKEGLFDAVHKKALPPWPKCLGVITSPTGAAIRDILSVLKRRFALLPIIIYPAQVQGNQAADQIVAALCLANLRQECDILIVARGGGSLEDLWPFNEERVARAMYASTIPLVTGIGHEIDTTIADFVADCRASTPSAAAELISPDTAKWEETLQRLHLRLHQAMRYLLNHYTVLLDHLQKRLPHPQKRLQDQAQRLDGINQRLQWAQKNLMQHKISLLHGLIAQLQYHAPHHRLRAALTHCLTLEQRLQSHLNHQLRQAQEKLMGLTQTLDTISPLRTLQRGYAIATQGNKIVRDTANVLINEQLNVKLAQGILVCEIIKKV